VGSIFLTGCVGLPVSESTHEQQSTTNEVVVEQSVSEPSVVDSVTENKANVAVNEQVVSSVEQSLVVNPANKESAQVVQQVGQANSLPQPRKDMQPTNAVSHWLALAEKAYAKDYLTTPAGINAYAYYGRVLLQEPDNRQALAGLEKIVQRYLSLALSSQRKGKAKQAKLFLQRANKVVPSHKDIAVVEAELKRISANAGKNKTKSPAKLVKQRQPAMKFAAIQTQQQSIMDAPDGMQRQRILLPPSALSQEAPALAIYLRRLARQIEDVDGRLFIIAPKDKQVRWVYSLLNGTNPDYRIRANMKHKKPAAIEVMYSGDEPLLDVFK
jgi:hypothetical protein